jgi:hypothetical protein
MEQEIRDEDSDFVPDLPGPGQYMNTFKTSSFHKEPRPEYL